MLISFGRVSKKFLLYLIIPFTYIIRSYIVPLYENRNIFILLDTKYYARMFNFIPWVLILFKNTSDSISYSIQNDDDISSKGRNLSQVEINFLEIQAEKKKKKIKSVLFLICMGCLDFFANFFYSLVSFTQIYNKRTNSITLNSLFIRVLAIIILSYFIFKSIKLHKHHIFSLTIILTVFSLMNFELLSYSTETDNIESYPDNLFISTLPQIVYAVLYVLGAKYLMMDENHVYKLLSSNGVIGIILSFIIQIILYFIRCENFCNYFSDIERKGEQEPFCKDGYFRSVLNDFDWTDLKSYLFSIILIIINYFNITSIWLLVSNYSADHYAAVYSIVLFHGFIYKQISSGKINIFVTFLNAIGCLIIIFMIFVYTEIIILRFWGLEENTKTEIERRSITDTESTHNKDLNES